MNLLLLLSGLSGAQDPWALIQRSELARTVPMEAVVRTTFWKPGKDGRSKTMRFRLIQDSGSVRVEPLEGGPRLEERHGKLEGHGKGPVPLPPRLPDEMELTLARRNYQAVLEKSDSISGRLCDVIRLKPVHPGGNGRRLWIDPITGLALRRDQYNERGELLRSSTMESVRHPSAPGPSAEAPHAASPDPRQPGPGGAPPPGPDRKARPQAGECKPDSKPLTTEEATRWLGFAAPQASWLPSGYVPVGILSHTCPEGGHAVRMSWSDGLSNFSVFVQPRGCLRPMERPQRNFFQKIGGWLHPKRQGMHPPVVFARLGDKGEIVAMGDVPRPLLEKVLSSMASPGLTLQLLPPKELP